MPQHDPWVAGAGGPGCLHKLLLFRGQHRTAHNARQRRESNHADGNGDIAHRRPDHSNQRQSENETGKGEIGVNKTLQHHIGFAAEVTGHYADHRAQQCANGDRD